MEKRHLTIDELIEKNIKDDEDANTIKLVQELKDVKQRGYLTKEELVKIGMRKSPRPKQLYLSNTEESVVSISKKALGASSEIEKIVYLTRLKGIKIPAASAILTLIDPQNYGVIDIRVWQVLYLYGLVDHNPNGIDFDANDWIDYLEQLRKYAHIFNVPVRDVERTLFIHHKEIQEGTLYG